MQERMWVRGETIGQGGYATVSLAMARRKHRTHLPPVMAVKWAEISRSCTIQKEKMILTNLQGCPHIVRCYGEDFTTENGEIIYNLLLEYASGGSLASRIENSNGGLPESEVRCYTRSILQGLYHIHKNNYIHCDIKPENILLVPCSSSSMRSNDYVPKIADFGLAKKIKEEKKRWMKEVPHLRGTPLFMSPEYVARNEQGPPSDIWALGCVVAEMISGKPVWNCNTDFHVNDLLSLIGSCRELPEIPADLSKEGKDFLKRCFVMTTKFRWTAEMLLYHPFVAVDNEDIEEAQEEQWCDKINEIKVQVAGSSAEEAVVRGRRSIHIF